MLAVVIQQQYYWNSSSNFTRQEKAMIFRHIEKQNEVNKTKH